MKGLLPLEGRTMTGSAINAVRLSSTGAKPWAEDSPFVMRTLMNDPGGGSRASWLPRTFCPVKRYLHMLWQLSKRLYKQGRGLISGNHGNHSAGRRRRIA